MRCRLLLGWTLALCSPLLAGCLVPQTGATRHLHVVATIAPIVDWVRQVGGARVTVYQLVPPGRDPRTYSLTGADQEQLQQADVIFLNGHGLDSWLNTWFDHHPPLNSIVLDFSDYVPSDDPPVRRRNGLVPGDGQFDSAEAAAPQDRQRSTLARVKASPYTWLDPALAHQMIALLAETLSRADRDGFHTYRELSARYSSEVDNLDVATQRALVPVQQRQVVDLAGFMQPFWVHYQFKADEPALDVLQPSRLPTVVDLLSSRPTEVSLLEQPIVCGIDPLNNASYLALMQTVTQQVIECLQH